MQRFRRGWLTLHRWVALSVGWVLVISGLSGALLVAAQPLDRWMHPEWFQAKTVPAAGQPQASLQAILEGLRPQFPPGAQFSLRPPHQSGGTLEVRVNGPWKGSAFVDPYTGLEQGRRATGEGAFQLLFKLHSSLWLQSTGKALLAWIALAYVFLLLAGGILWWPRKWPPVWRPEIRKGLLRALFDLHRIGGAVLGAVILVSVATGAYMAWRPLGGAINWLAGDTLFKPPALLPGERSGAVPASLDVLVEKARQTYPDAAVGVVQVPVDVRHAVRIRMRMPDEPHPHGISSVWLDPVSAQVLGARRWDELDAGTGAVAVIYPLHTGELGGLLLQIVVACVGLALAGLGFSGIWLWWRRRAVRAQQARRFVSPARRKRRGPSKAA